MQRERHQQGSLQVKKHGKHKMWILQYRSEHHLRGFPRRRGVAVLPEQVEALHCSDLAEFGETKLQAITLKSLQAFLNRKAKDLSRGVVAHLRLRIFAGTCGLYSNSRWRKATRRAIPPPPSTPRKRRAWRRRVS